jgi:hypothetical protein
LPTQTEAKKDFGVPQMSGIESRSVDLFQTVLVPVLLINGVGLFLLVLQTRYGRIVDRMRTLNHERRNIVKSKILSRSEIEKTWDQNRLSDIDEQMKILVRRGKLLKDALKYMFIAIFASIIASFLLFIEMLTTVKLTLVVLFLLLFVMIMLFVAGVNGIREVTSSYTAVMFDIDTHAPEG